MIRHLLLAAAVVLTAVGAAQAQASKIVDGSQIDEIVSVAHTYGTATLGTQSNGDPKISGRIEGVTYHLFLMNCTDNTACEDMNFYAGFLDNKPTLEAINDWNRDKRFGKAYLDGDLDAVIEFDLNLEHGITRANLGAAFEIWSLILEQYTSYIGFE